MKFGGLGGLAATALKFGSDWLGSKISNTQNWEYDKKAMDYAYNQQLDFWNKTNDYNSPVSQMQRLEEAGLNPNLVYGSGGATHQATMPTASASRGKTQGISGINPLIGQQMENMEAQNELLRAQRSAEFWKAGVYEGESSIKNAEARIAQKRADSYERTGIDPSAKDSFVDLIKVLTNWFGYDIRNGR